MGFTQNAPAIFLAEKRAHCIQVDIHSLKTYSRIEAVRRHPSFPRGQHSDIIAMYIAQRTEIDTGFTISGFSFLHDWSSYQGRR